MLCYVIYSCSRYLLSIASFYSLRMATDENEVRKCNITCLFRLSRNTEIHYIRRSIAWSDFVNLACNQWFPNVISRKKAKEMNVWTQCRSSCLPRQGDVIDAKQKEKQASAFVQLQCCPLFYVWQMLTSAISFHNNNTIVLCIRKGKKRVEWYVYFEKRVRETAKGKISRDTFFFLHWTVESFNITLSFTLHQYNLTMPSLSVPVMNNVQMKRMVMFEKPALANPSLMDINETEFKVKLSNNSHSLLPSHLCSNDNFK